MSVTHGGAYVHRLLVIAFLLATRRTSYMYLFSDPFQMAVSAPGHKASNPAGITILMSFSIVRPRTREHELPCYYHGTSSKMCFEETFQLESLNLFFHPNALQER